jgi:adenine-specific DNA methylase
MKRPFNLFHRNNLSIRTADVERAFGNKATWETPFEVLFRRAAEEGNRAVFASGKEHRVTSFDALECPIDVDLVYLDPPYVRADGAAFDYADGYHFLDGLAEPAGWSERLDRRRRHLPLKRPRSVFLDATKVEASIDAIVERARDAHVIVSYRDDGVPSIDGLATMLRRHGRRVEILEAAPRAYALSTKTSREVAIVAPRAGSRSKTEKIRIGAGERKRR